MAFILRILFIPQGAVSFHYDMARDAYVAQQIWKDRDLKILGPPTSTEDLYHGVLYYYLIAPFYGLGQGDPKIVALILSLINSLTVIPISLLAKDLFKQTRWVVLAGLFFVVSFEASQYGPWLSNPGPAMFTVAWFFYFLRLWQKGKSFGLYLAAVFATLSAQFQFFLVYLLVLMIIFKFLFKIRVSIRQVVFSLGLTLIGFSTFVISTIKFGTFQKILSGLVSIPQIGQFTFHIQFSEVFVDYINRFADIFINNFLPANIFLGGLLGFIVLYFCRKNTFILFGLLSNGLIFIFGGHSSTFANVGMVTPAILAMVFFLQKIWSKSKLFYFLIFVLIVSSNLYTVFKITPFGQLALVIPKDMVLKGELQLIDKTYELTEGRPFSINTLTLPLWTNTTWAYLYSWYGLKKYGYVPEFYGHDQVGLLGNDSLERIEKPHNKTFFIIEPHVGIPENRFEWEIGSEESKTDLIKEYSYGELKLQYRKPKTDG